MASNFGREEVPVENSAAGAHGQQLALEEHRDERRQEDGATRETTEVSMFCQPKSEGREREQRTVGTTGAGKGGGGEGQLCPFSLERS